MKSLLTTFLCLLAFGIPCATTAAPLNLADSPLFLTDTVPPLTMLVLGRDHKLFYEAYNDAADIDGDGVIDVGYKPDTIDYYGYFDSYKCYSYGSSRFNPVSVTANKKCSGQWSGDFLNYLTMTRMDILRKSLYGGFRSTDSNTATILERARIVQDAHSWGKEYRSIAVDGYNIADYTPYSAPTGSNRHLFANTTLQSDASGHPRLRVLLNSGYRIWEWVSIERPVANNRVLNGGSGPTVTPTDFYVRVLVCASGLEENNCQSYPNGNSKPIGLLHRFGENQSMKFGLITGSWGKNLSGGMLRKNIGYITDEIDPNSGILTATTGIIRTINNMRILGFSSGYEHTSNCGYIFDRKFFEGECRAWGNPIAEMMYESLRYFAGKGSPTADYYYLGGDDAALGMPAPAWQNPYAPANNPYCAKPNMLVISDTNPSYDSDQLPGSAFGSFTGDLSGLNVSTLGQTIWDHEMGGPQSKFIGVSGADNDEAPTLKTITSFGNIRGLAPEEPTKEGSYYSASVAYFGATNDLNSAQGNQKAKTFTMTFSSPVATIPIQVGDKTITIAPFAKSVGGCKGNGYMPTNTIVDFYVEGLGPTVGVFRVNFEDAEQGADHDMDAIVRYSYQVNANNTVSITLNSTYAAGCIIQHMGYVISGTTADGTYLEVRDADTSTGADVDYFLDTPPGQLPGGNWNDNTALPLNTTRTFTPSATGVATPVLPNPLWYAAKWGSFNDINGNNIPDNPLEWDVDGDGVPDNYFLVSQPQFIEQQLTTLFNNVLAQSSSASSSSVNSSALNSETRLYQAKFNSENWTGSLLSFALNPATGALITTGSGPFGSLWDAGLILDNQNWSSGREIITYLKASNTGVKYDWSTVGTTVQNYHHINPVSGVSDSQGQARLEYIRGKRNAEIQNGGTFRNRDHVMGDIVNSSPVFVTYPSFPYAALAFPSGSAETGSSAETYAQFKANNINRQAMLYVGANDGMLHFVNANNGRIEMSYIPAAVLPRLNVLTNPDYAHQYFVDGSPNVGDVFFSTDQKWHTVLASGLNKGGQAIFALDITNPTLFADENNASQIVLWEFNDSDDADLGYTFSQPQIVRLNNGQWAAIFGNGYNNTVADGNASTTGNAVLYIVDIRTGTLIKKIDTGVGSSSDPLATGRPNGLATPAVADIDGDFIADYVYAGDLFGNLWKFDLRDANPANWGVSFSGQPLFVAIDASSNRQPITSQPSLGVVENSPRGIYVFFGTGKYIEASDNNPATSGVQTFYGVKDLHTTPTIRGQLLQQQILAEQTYVGGDNPTIRVVSNNFISAVQRGWYLDLQVSGQPATGERQVTRSIIRNKKIIFTTIIPSQNVCEFGGTGWLMELDMNDGSRLDNTPFDLNKDNDFTDSDKVSYAGAPISASGIKSSSGLIQPPSIISTPTIEYKYSTSTSGNIEIVGENPGLNDWGRQSWIQVR
ncbi:MAG: hypothetical protein KIT27_03560 [Legionellales bacterium]|nr:hypothetical protein [Legionellales bacterium]